MDVIEKAAVFAPILDLLAVSDVVEKDAIFAPTIDLRAIYDEA